MLVLSPFAILQPRNLPALQSSLVSIPISSRLWLAPICCSHYRAIFGSPFSWLSSTEPSSARPPHPLRICPSARFLIFSQYFAHIPRILPICLDFRHPNPKKASFSKNISRKIWWIQENVVLLHSLSGKRYQTPLEREQKERVL